MNYYYPHLLAMLLGLLLSFQVAAEVPRYSIIEKAWLNNHQILRVGVIEQTPPILSFSGTSDNPKGLVADYLRALALHLGMELEITRFPKWEPLVTALMSGELDVIGAAVAGFGRRTPLIYSRPYLQLPVTLYSKKSLPSGGLTGLKGKSIAVVEGDLWEEAVLVLAPELTLKPFPSLSEALQAVSDGKVYAYLGDSASADYLLKRESMPGIKEKQALDLTYDIALASPVWQPELQSLLQKGLDRFGEQELKEIWRRWPDVERPRNYPTGITRVYILLPLVLLWTVLVAWLAQRLSKRKYISKDTRMKRTIHRLRRRESRLRNKLLQLKTKAMAYRGEVREQRQRLRLYEKVMPSGAWIWDANERQCQWDEEMFALFQRQAGTFVPTREAILECIYESDREKVANLFDTQESEGETRLSYRIQLPDGTLRWLLDFSHVSGHGEPVERQRVGVCWDISDYLATDDLYDLGLPGEA